VAALGGPAWAGHDVITLDGGALGPGDLPGGFDSGSGPGSDGTEIPGLGDSGDLGDPGGLGRLLPDRLGDLVDAEAAVGSSVDTGPTLLGGAAWVTGVLIVALLASRRTPLPRGWDAVHRVVRPAASALVAVLLVAVAAGCAAAAYAAIGDDHPPADRGGRTARGTERCVARDDDRSVRAVARRGHRRPHAFPPRPARRPPRRLGPAGHPGTARGAGRAGVAAGGGGGAGDAARGGWCRRRVRRWTRPPVGHGVREPWASRGGARCGWAWRRRSPCRSAVRGSAVLRAGSARAPTVAHPVEPPARSPRRLPGPRPAGPPPAPPLPAPPPGRDEQGFGGEGGTRWLIVMSGGRRLGGAQCSLSASRTSGAGGTGCRLPWEHHERYADL